MNELDRILDGLIRRTSDAKLRWSRTAISNEFATSIDTISLTIGLSAISQDGLTGTPRLEIYNERGDLAEVILVDEHSDVDQDGKLRRLHELARGSALNTQETLEKLAKALEA